MMELSAALVFIVLRLRNNLEDDFPVQLAVESLGFCLSGKLLPLPTLLKVNLLRKDSALEVFFLR